MKKILVLLFLLVLAAPVFAKPVTSEYRGDGFDVKKLGSVLVMPISYDLLTPQPEPFFDETVSQKWRDNTAQMPVPFLVKAPADIFSRDNSGKGAAPQDLSGQQTADRARQLAGEYVNAVLTASVTQAGVNVIHHPEEVTWRTRYVKRDVWVYDHWEQHEFPVEYQDVKPAWDETATTGAVKLELRDSKSPEKTLLYGIAASEENEGGFFTPAPTITKHICNLLEYAVKTMVKKK